MLQQVGKTRLQSLEVLLVEIGFRHAAVIFERAHRGDDHHCIGLQPREAAFDVEELLRTQIGAEARLGHAVVAERHGHARGHDGVAAMRDVGERAAVHERRRALERLHQVGLERVLQQRAHRALGMQIVRGDGFVVVGVADDDAPQALLEIGDGGCQAEDGHDLGRHRDVEAVLARHAVRLAAQAVDDVAQLAIVHVDDTLPGNLAHVDAEFVAVVDMRVEERREQVVRRADGVEVAGEVEVDVLHRDNLGVSAAGGAALDAEHRPEGRLAQRHHDVLAATRQRVSQADRGGGLALARRRGIDGRHQDELAGRMILFAQKVVINLRLILAVALKVLLVDACALRDLGDALRLSRLGNFNVSQHVGPAFCDR